ncbi:MAG TPA: hypothetical protein VKB88_35230 [Bryobacteraceae bacterium]|nr:hypothetical protein [Bryobacteraceae bacterium]
MKTHHEIGEFQSDSSVKTQHDSLEVSLNPSPQQGHLQTNSSRSDSFRMKDAVRTQFGSPGRNPDFRVVVLLHNNGGCRHIGFASQFDEHLRAGIHSG